MYVKPVEKTLNFIGRYAKTCIVLLLVCVTAACVTIPVPDDALNRAEVAISKAMAAGAGQYAVPQLRAARKALVTARQQSQSNDNMQARYSAESAQAHAELAQALAEAERADQRADKAETDLARVRNQIKQQREPVQ